MSHEIHPENDREHAGYGDWVPSTRFIGVSQLIDQIQQTTGKEVIATVYRGKRAGMPDDLLLGDYSYVDRTLLGQTYWSVMEQLGAEVILPDVSLAEVIPIDRHEALG